TELERTRTQLESLNAERESNRSVTESAFAQADSARYEAESRQRAADEAARKLLESERELELQRLSVLDVISAGGNLRNQITQGEEHLASLDRDSERLRRECDEAIQEIESMGGRRGQITLEWESISEAVSSLSARISEVRAQIDTKRAAEVQARG